MSRLLQISVPTLLVVLIAVSCGDSGDPDAPAPQARTSRSTPATTPATTPAPDGAAPGHCDGAIGARTVDEVRIPAGATCTLARTVVEGNISVARGATLRARGVDVDGDVEAEGARYVEVRAGSRIGGNLQADAGGPVTVTDSAVDGDLELEENRGALRVRSVRVRGNLALDENRGGVVVTRTDVGNDLTCEENSPAPSVTDADVSGSREGQCAR